VPITNVIRRSLVPNIAIAAKYKRDITAATRYQKILKESCLAVIEAAQTRASPAASCASSNRSF